MMEPGDKVRILKIQYVPTGEGGVIERKGDTGGYWVRMDDGREAYYPFSGNLEKVKE